jgi:hypothetical protein
VTSVCLRTGKLAILPAWRPSQTTALKVMPAALLTLMGASKAFRSSGCSALDSQGEQVSIIIDGDAGSKFEELSPDEFRREKEGSWSHPAVDMLLTSSGLLMRPVPNLFEINWRLINHSALTSAFPETMPLCLSAEGVRPEREAADGQPALPQAAQIPFSYRCLVGLRATPSSKMTGDIARGRPTARAAHRRPLIDTGSYTCAVSITLPPIEVHA